MKHFLYVALFTAGISLFYTGIAQIDEMQHERAAPPVLKWGQAMPAEELVAAGSEVFANACVQCHKIGEPGGRCPDLSGIGRRADGRAMAAGDASGLDYLLEALCDPGAYLVDGFGNIMPAQTKALSGPEMVAVTAFLQDQDGTVTLSLADVETSQALLADNGCGAALGGPQAPAAAVAAAEPLGTPEEVFAQFGCSGCHLIDKPDRSVGPSLQDVGNRLDKWALYESLVDPDAALAAGFPPGLMKATLDGNGFYERMSPADYQALVEWLSELKG